MRCPICEVQFIGFIGASCTCGTQPEPQPPENGVTNNGVLVTNNGETVTNGDA